MSLSEIIVTGNSKSTEIVLIPSFSMIERINSISLSLIVFCSKLINLRKLEIPYYSQLQIIEDRAFLMTKIERIFIR